MKHDFGSEISIFTNYNKVLSIAITTWRVITIAADYSSVADILFYISNAINEALTFFIENSENPSKRSARFTHFF